MADLIPSPDEHLYERIAAILDEARGRVARTVNTAMVHAYWLIGREIVEVEQQGKEPRRLRRATPRTAREAAQQAIRRGTGRGDAPADAGVLPTFPKGRRSRAISVYPLHEHRLAGRSA